MNETGNHFAQLERSHQSTFQADRETFTDPSGNVYSTFLATVYPHPGGNQLMAKAVGIRELAKHLDLSIGTVSRALKNGRPYVDRETRQRVLEAAATLDYTPNQSGRSLRQGATGMVSMMVPVSGKVAVANSIFMIVMEGFRVAIAESGLELMILFDDRTSGLHLSAAGHRAAPRRRPHHCRYPADRSSH